MAIELKNIMPVILAGGKSKRMGQNKAFASLGGKLLLTIVAEKLENWFGAPPLLVANDTELYADFNLPMTTDIFPGMGPMAGIHAALRVSDKPYIFVVGCDMPFLNKELLYYMANEAKTHDLVVPCDGDRLEPLHAIYSLSCLSYIEACLKRGEKKIIVFFPEVNARYLKRQEIERFSPDGRVFMNVNTPEELTAAESMIEQL
jgi:molybdopterin-guanine dinucleotide biosynthesis protein A